MSKKKIVTQNTDIVPHSYNRREAFGAAAKGFVGVNLSLGLMNVIGSLTPEQALFNKILEIVTLKDPAAFSQAISGETRPFVQFVLVDKVTQALIFRAQGDVGTNDLNGLNGAGQNFKGRSVAGKALESATWRNVEGMTALWADILSQMPDNYNVAFLPQTTSNVGGHNLNTANLGDGLGGANYFVDSKGKSGVLGSTLFSFRGAANDSANAAQTPTGTAMSTYTGVGQLRSTLNSAYKALLDPKSLAAKLRNSFDRLALNDDQTSRQINAMRDTIQPVLEPLRIAAIEGDYIDQQVAAVEAMAKTGLSNNFMIAATTADTNAGGNLNNGGGSNNDSPHIAHANIAFMLTRLAQKIPNYIGVLASDGSRRGDNGDSAAAMMTFVSGPADLIKNGVHGYIPTVDQYGSANAIEANGEDIQMSNGTTTKLLEQRNVLSAAVELATGNETGVEYPNAFIKKNA